MSGENKKKRHIAIIGDEYESDPGNVQPHIIDLDPFKKRRKFSSKHYRYPDEDDNLWTDVRDEIAAREDARSIWTQIISYFETFIRPLTDVEKTTILNTKQNATKLSSKNRASLKGYKFVGFEENGDGTLKLDENGNIIIIWEENPFLTRRKKINVNLFLTNIMEEAKESVGKGGTKKRNSTKKRKISIKKRKSIKRK
jgi:hypothetical protein